MIHFFYTQIPAEFPTLRNNIWTLGSCLSGQLHNLNANSHSIIRISQNSKGKGAYAKKTIIRGTVLCAFIGTVSSKKEISSDFRTPCQIDHEDVNLFIHCRVNKKSNASYFNHECEDANCAIIIKTQIFQGEGVYAEQISVGWPYIKALRDIPAEEELTLNYGMGNKNSIVQHNTHKTKTNLCLCRTCAALPERKRRRF